MVRDVSSTLSDKLVLSCDEHFLITLRLDETLMYMNNIGMHLIYFIGLCTMRLITQAVYTIEGVSYPVVVSHRRGERSPLAINVH